MKVAIPLPFIPAQKIFGGRTYAQGFLKALTHLNSQHEYLILPSRSNESLWKNHLNGRSSLKRVYHWESGNLMSRLARKLERRLGQLQTVCEVLQAEPVDLIHYVLPRMAECDFSEAVPFVVTVHDLINETFPGYVLQEKTKQIEKRIILNAAKIITVSQFTKKTLMRVFGVSEAKIQVIANGVDRDLFKKQSFQQVQPILKKYSVQSPYLIYPAGLWPHKNHKMLLIALKQLLKTEKNLQLVLTGQSESDSYTQDILEFVQDEQLSSHVRFLGEIPNQDMSSLYSGAEALVFPSLFEGFGLPVLEAMACGCPVICSRIEPLVEVAGEAAAFFHPEDSGDIAKTISQILENSDFRKSLIEKGSQRVQGFSWERCALETLKVYEEVLSTTRGQGPVFVTNEKI